MSDGDWVETSIETLPAKSLSSSSSPKEGILGEERAQLWYRVTAVLLQYYRVGRWHA
jgi:hypothetical protein